MMNEAITRRSLRLYTFITGFIFVALFIFYGLANHFDSLLFFQVLSLFVCIIALLLGLRCKRLSQILIIVLICQLFFLVGMSFFDPTEGIADKENYEEFVREMMRKRSFSDILGMFLNPEYSGMGDMSDLGYTLPLYWCYSFFGWKAGAVVMGIFKVICHLLSCVIIYKLIYRIFGSSDALFVSLFWGVNMNAAFFLLAGLKETIFVLFVLFAIHRMCIQIRKPSLFNLSVFALATFSTFLFRIVFPVLFIVTYLLYVVIFDIKSRIFRNLLLFVSVGLCVTVVYIIFRDSFLSVMLRLEEGDEEFTKMPFYMKIINGFVSPYPCLRPDGAKSNLLVAGYSAIHTAFCAFAILGVYYSIKHKIKEMFPFVGVLILNLLMLIITGFSMNVRFLYPTHIIYYAFIPFGVRYCWKKSFLIPYIGAIMIIILKYNALI